MRCHTSLIFHESEPQIKRGNDVYVETPLGAHLHSLNCDDLLHWRCKVMISAGHRLIQRIKHRHPP